MLQTVLALLKSDSRIATQLLDNNDLFKSTFAIFCQIKSCEDELVTEFLIHESLTQPFVLAKILSLRLSQFIIQHKFNAKAKKMTALLAKEAKEVLELARESPDFVEHMNEQSVSSLAILVNTVCQSYPAIVSTKYRDQFNSVATIHAETNAAKASTPQDAAVKLVKDMFPDLGTGFVEEVVGFYRGKTEEIINALLEDNLHPQLAALDRQLKSKAELEKESKKKTIIPGLYHKKAKTAKEEIGNRKDQIFVNAVAKQYKYVVEEVTVAETEKTVVEDETGVEYRADTAYDDEYDDTYDDVQKEEDFDPYALAQARTREKNAREETERYGRVELPSNPNLPQEPKEEDETSDQSRTSSRASLRDGKVSAPRAAYASSNPTEPTQQQEHRGYRKLNEDSSKLAKRRKDVNKAKQANHNRKAMADKKRAKGMI